MRDSLIVVYLAALFVTNVYRAATQSITHDEALSYLWFASRPWAYIFSAYDANHHVLNTILIKLTTSIFGLSELSMRLPSLAGGLIYLFTIYHLCKLLLKKTVYLLPAIGLLTLNPFVLDFLVVARGYGLAMGFLLWSLYQLVAYLTEPTNHSPRRRLLKASIGLSLSLSSNLSFLYADLAVAVVFILIYLRGLSLTRPAFRRLASVVVDFCVPGALLATLVNIGPVSHATSGQLYFGSPSLREAVQSVLYYSLCHAPRERESLVCGPYDEHPLAAVIFLLVLAGVLLAVLAVAIFRKRAAAASALMLLNGSFILCLVLIVAAHYTFGVLYPKDRTGIFLLPLFILSFAYTAQYLESIWGKAALLLMPVHLVLLLVLVQHAMQFNLRYFSIWRFDASTKTISAIVSSEGPRPDGRLVRLGINGLYKPSVNFYRVMRHADWIETIDNPGPDSNCDYYLLFTGDAIQWNRAGKNLTLLYEDRTSGAKLYIPGR
jgi:hypothetical protein